MTRTLTALAAALALSSAWAHTPEATQSTPVPSPSGLETSSASPAAPNPACCDVAANTVVELEILDLLTSAAHKRGDMFRLRVVTPVVIDGATLIATGTSGIGQVVHAAPARGGGAPGELSLAARSLDINGQVVTLRGLKLGLTGGDNSGMALGIAFAAGPFALFVRGGEIEIPAGTRVNARLAHGATLAPVPSVSPPTAISTQE